MKPLHPKTYGKLRTAFDADDLARRISDVIQDGCPENVMNTDASPYEWPLSEALVVARWLRREGIVES